jgi:UDP-glucose 4-epimerase
MKVLVCGGAGYIGSHMCKSLAKAGHSVTVFDNLSTGHSDMVRWGPFIRGDLLNPEDIANACSIHAFDAVMHFCARSLVGESMAKPDVYYLNNVAGTVHLLSAMAKNRIDKLVFSSSAAVYGVPTYTPIDEEHPRTPINPYGRSKLMVESLLPDFEAAYSIRSVSLRYFNAAGADPSAEIGERHDPETHLIPNILKSIVSGSSYPLKIFGNDYDTPDGTCVRDYIHVTDLCDAHLRALQYLNNGGHSTVFNLGSGRGFSVFEVVAATEEVTGHAIPYSIDHRRAGDPPILVASADRARSVLGWEPHYPDLKEIIRTAWHWHRR